MQRYSDVIQNKNGRPMPGLRIVVDPYVDGAAPNLTTTSGATIYATDGGASVASVLSDADGRFSFYAPDGRYNLTVTGAGIAAYMLADVTLNDPANDVRADSIRAQSSPSEFIAHRGLAGSALQNTMLAFSTAIRRGMSSIEFDLQISSDGVIYAFHDTTVDVLTSGTGTFTNLTSATIDALTFDAAAGTIFSDERVPRLADVLAIAQRTGAKIYPEIKGVWSADKQQELIDTLQQYGFNNGRCCIQSGYIVYIEDLRKLSANIELLYVGTGTLAASTSFINRVAAAGKGSVGWAMSELIAEPAFVTYCYSKNVDVVAFTVISSDNVRQMRAVGVRRFFTDIFIESIS